MQNQIIRCTQQCINFAVYVNKGPVQYLISEFTDELGVIVVCFDDICLATGKMRGTLNEIWPQGTLGQENLLWFQIHLSDHFICHL